MKTYLAFRDASAIVRCLVYESEDSNATMLHHWPYHSPDGFEMGYPGSGPADLALAILSDHFRVPEDFDYTLLRHDATREQGGGTFETRRSAWAAWRLHQPLKDMMQRSKNFFLVTDENLRAFAAGWEETDPKSTKWA